MTNRLRAIRDERDWTQDQLARALGVSRQTINAIEAGRNDPSLELALRIARLFDRTVESIFMLDDRDLWGV